VDNQVIATETTLEFSGQNAYNHVQVQMSYGFRIPDTEGNRKTQEYIKAKMENYGFTVSKQPFVGTQGEGEGINFVNIIARRQVGHPNCADIILGAHFDTRPFTDHNNVKDPIPPDYDNPVPGANDGGSGVGALLELGRVFGGANITKNLIFIFFDGEDYGTDLGSMLYGSRYYAEQMTNEEVQNTESMILLDMMGDAELTIYREKNSDPGLMDDIWAKARDLGYPEFKDATKYRISDDHIPFRDLGITVVDLIDFDYPNETYNYWHTTEDTIDKVSAHSLEVVGRTVEAYLRDVAVAEDPSNGNGSNGNITPPPPPPPPPKKNDTFPGFEGPLVFLAIGVAILICFRRYDS
jgi:hypothetical protein